MRTFLIGFDSNGEATGGPKELLLRQGALFAFGTQFMSISLARIFHDQAKKSTFSRFYKSILMRHVAFGAVDPKIFRIYPIMSGF